MASPHARHRSSAGPSSPADQPQRQGSHDLLNYQLGERVGQDELATIYRATHTTLERPVLVYVLRRTDWISVSRFQLAGRLAARLSHANLLQVIDAGHDTRYGDYMVTPLLDAQPLDQRLKAGPIDALAALRIVGQVASALDYLHGQGVVHRDVQPRNIMVTEQGTAYLANLSLAAAPETPDFSSVEEADYRTLYSAPEQSLRNGRPAPSLDVYSLGAVLYHMLSGEAPRPGLDPAPLATRDPALAEVDRVVRRLLAPQPAQRYSSGGQAVAALRQALRPQIDASTTDMEESSWETIAEWLENPLETVANDYVDAEFIARSRTRADGLHRVDAVRRLLDRWSRHGLVRRPQFGQLMEPEQIVSYNLYLYELKVAYETRTSPEPRQTPHRAGAINTARELDLWDVPVPEVGPFDAAAPQQIPIPGSQRIVGCGDCGSTGKVPCKVCAGTGTVARTRKVQDVDGKTRAEPFHEQCPTCHGYGREGCARCEGSGTLLEEKVFTWSRHAKVFGNEDDTSGLHRLTLRSKAQTVFEGTIDPYEGRWHQVAPLRELMDEALRGGGDDARVAAAELSIRGVPVTEVDYRFRDKPRTLALIGFDNTIRGDATLYDVERIALYVVIAIMAITLALVLVLR